MSDLIPFPFVRQSYADIDNPVYSQDIVAANQEILAAITAISGLGVSDFAIFSGLQYIQVVSGSNYYTPGVFYLNGTWYYQPTAFNELLYLKPNIQGTLPYTFSDTVTRSLYSINYGQAATLPTGASPQFTGNMNAYRLDLKTLSQEIAQLQLLVALQNVQVASLPTTLTLTFTNDKAMFFAAAPANCNITFDFTNAVPGVVIRLRWTYGAGRSLTVTTPEGGSTLQESGSLTAVSSAINVMYFLYTGVNSSGLNEVSFNISQATSI